MINHPPAPGLAWVEIDTRQLVENVRRLKALTRPETSFMAVVKGDGFGHGLFPSAAAALAAGADRLGVAFVTEGGELRSRGVEAPIHVIGAIAPEQVPDLVAHNLMPSVGDTVVAEALKREAGRLGRIIPVHVKIDTGLHRLGFLPKEAVDFIRECRGGSALAVEGLYTHMARADDGDVAETDRQFRLFEDVCRAAGELGVRPRFRHVAATSLTIDRPDLHLDMVRVGVGLFGYAPLPGQAARAGIKPVLSFKTRIAQVHEVGPGEGVGYEHLFRTEGPSRIGTLPVGYVDGLLFGLERGGHALVRGRRVPVRGKGSMDHTLVDLTGVPEARPWDEVVLIGRQGDESVGADEWARIGDRAVEDVLGGLVRKRLARVEIGTSVV